MPLSHRALVMVTLFLWACGDSTERADAGSDSGLDLGTAADGDLRDAASDTGLPDVPEAGPDTGASCAAGEILCDAYDGGPHCADPETECLCGTCRNVCMCNTFGCRLNGPCHNELYCASDDCSVIECRPDLETNSRHCGDCFNACGVGEICVAAHCEPPSRRDAGVDGG